MSTLHSQNLMPSFSRPLLFSPVQFRGKCAKLARTKALENVVLLMILGNCVTLVLFDSEDRTCLTQACQNLKVRLCSERCDYTLAKIYLR